MLLDPDPLHHQITLSVTDHKIINNNNGIQQRRCDELQHFQDHCLVYGSAESPSWALESACEVGRFLRDVAALNIVKGTMVHRRLIYSKDGGKM